MDSMLSLMGSLLWLGSMLAICGLVFGVSALVRAATVPPETFGPPWDNTRSAWLLGLGVSFVIPFGSLVAGVHWFAVGDRQLRLTGVVARPFWAGPPKPPPEFPSEAPPRGAGTEASPRRTTP